MLTRTKRPTLPSREELMAQIEANNTKIAKLSSDLQQETRRGIEKDKLIASQQSQLRKLENDMEEVQMGTSSHVKDLLERQRQTLSREYEAKLADFLSRQDETRERIERMSELRVADALRSEREKVKIDMETLFRAERAEITRSHTQVLQQLDADFLLAGSRIQSLETALDASNSSRKQLEERLSSLEKHYDHVRACALQYLRYKLENRRWKSVFTTVLMNYYVKMWKWRRVVADIHVAMMHLAGLACGMGTVAVQPDAAYTGPTNAVHPTYHQDAIYNADAAQTMSATYNPAAVYNSSVAVSERCDDHAASLDASIPSIDAHMDSGIYKNQENFDFSRFTATSSVSVRAEELERCAQSWWHREHKAIGAREVRRDVRDGVSQNSTTGNTKATDSADTPPAFPSTSPSTASASTSTCASPTPAVACTPLSIPRVPPPSLHSPLPISPPAPTPAPLLPSDLHPSTASASCAHPPSFSASSPSRPVGSRVSPLPPYPSASTHTHTPPSLLPLAASLPAPSLLPPAAPIHPLSTPPSLAALRTWLARATHAHALIDGQFARKQRIRVPTQHVVQRMFGLKRNESGLNSPENTHHAFSERNISESTATSTFTNTGAGTGTGAGMGMGVRDDRISSLEEAERSYRVSHSLTELLRYMSSSMSLIHANLHLLLQYSAYQSFLAHAHRQRNSELLRTVHDLEEALGVALDAGNAFRLQGHYYKQLYSKAKVASLMVLARARGLAREKGKSGRDKEAREARDVKDRGEKGDRERHVVDPCQDGCDMHSVRPTTGLATQPTADGTISRDDANIEAHTHGRNADTRTRTDGACTSANITSDNGSISCDGDGTIVGSGGDNGEEVGSMCCGDDRECKEVCGARDTTAPSNSTSAAISRPLPPLPPMRTQHRARLNQGAHHHVPQGAHTTAKHHGMYTNVHQSTPDSQHESQYRGSSPDNNLGTHLGVHRPPYSVVHPAPSHSAYHDVIEGTQPDASQALHPSASQHPYVGTGAGVSMGVLPPVSTDCRRPPTRNTQRTAAIVSTSGGAGAGVNSSVGASPPYTVSSHSSQAVRPAHSSHLPHPHYTSPYAVGVPVSTIGGSSAGTGSGSPRGGVGGSVNATVDDEDGNAVDGRDMRSHCVRGGDSAPHNVRSSTPFAPTGVKPLARNSTNTAHGDRRVRKGGVSVGSRASTGTIRGKAQYTSNSGSNSGSGVGEAESGVWSWGV